LTTAVNTPRDTEEGRPRLEHEIRKGEVTVPLPDEDGPRLFVIGRIRTPWTRREDCPRQGWPDGLDCRIELDERWSPALEGITAYDQLEILYWLDRARRDLVRQNLKHDGERYFGTFALRSPQRPNPIGTSVVPLISVEGNVLTVRGLDCLDDTPLLDIKPFRGEFTPKAAPK